MPHHSLSMPSPTLALIGAGHLGRHVARALLRLRPASLTLADDTSTISKLLVPASAAATLAAELARPEVTTRSLPEVLSYSSDWDLVVVASDYAEPDRGTAELLGRGSATQLYVRADGDAASVGPLVVPGTSACLHCADLTSRDRDPSWPHSLLRLMHRRATSSTVAIAWAAATVALEASWYLSTGASGAIDTIARIRVGVPGITYAPVEPHPECPCGAATSIVITNRHVA